MEYRENTYRMRRSLRSTEQSLHAFHAGHLDHLGKKKASSNPSGVGVGGHLRRAISRQTSTNVAMPQCRWRDRAGDVFLCKGAANAFSP